MNTALILAAFLFGAIVVVWVVARKAARAEKELENAKQQIKEQPIRIMRFFRFYSIFGKGEPDLKSLKACVENRDLLKTVAIEQVRDELAKILLTPNVVNTLQIMFENDILSYILPISKNLSILQNLSDLIITNNLEPSALRRLYVIYFPDEALAENLAMRLHMSKENKSRLVNWAKFNINGDLIADDNYLKKIIYLHGKEFCKDKVLFYAAKNNLHDFPIKEIFAKIEESATPKFPVTGADLITLGIDDNAKIGATLNLLKQKWIQSNFCLTENELTDIAKKLAC